MRPCPRCGGEREDAFGPCEACRLELRSDEWLERQRRRAAAHEPAPDDDPDPRAAPAAELEHVVPAGVTLGDRITRFTPRATLFFDWPTGAGVTDGGRLVELPPAAELGGLLELVPPSVRRVVLCGQLPWGDVGELRRFVNVELPVPWRVHDRGHYVGRYESPLLRFWRDRQAVDVITAAGWFGRECVDPPAVIREAFAELLRVMDGAQGSLGLSAWLTTPGNTGAMAWLRTVPDEGWPIMPDELREELRTLTPQARIETMAPPAGDLPRVVEVDGRFMYGAVPILRAAPGTVPYRATGELEEHEQYLPSRCLVDATVPTDWDHVGIVGVRDGSWSWPAAPRQRVRGWVDGAELHVARKHRWHVRVLERIVWPKGGEPLRTFGERIGQARAVVADHMATGAVDERPGELARAALRRMLTDTIGKFAAVDGFTSEHWAPIDTAEPPEYAIKVRIEGDGIAWEEPSPDARAGLLKHPEWSHAVWGRTRARMLEGPKFTGALHVPRPELLAISTDALYLTDTPAWSLPVDQGGADDGTDGRLRLKAVHDGPHKAPAGRTQLLALLDRLRS